MSSIYRERPKKSVSRVSIESKCPRNVERRQQVRFLYRSFYVNMENLHFFFWSCCYLGVLSNRHTSLSIRVHALWMSYNEQSLYLYLKKKNCPRILKSTLRPSPSVLSCNRVDVTLTSMYTKVLTEWDDTKRSTKCWQRNLSQNSPLPVLIHFVYDLPSSRKFFSVSLWEGSELRTGLVRFQIFILLLMQTLHEVQSLETLPGSDRGWIWDSEVCEEECFVTGINTRQHRALHLLTKTFSHSYCTLFSTKIQTWLLYFPLWSKSIVNEFISERYFDPMESKLVIICQHRITMYELIVPKWSVCIGFFPLFLFPSVYTCCCISKEGFGGQSWNVGAKTQSTLFENHKGLGLRWSLFQ